MRTYLFNNFKNFTKEEFEESIQYMGWFFMQLSPKQNIYVYDRLVELGYPVIKDNGFDWVVFPNGMRLRK